MQNNEFEIMSKISNLKHQDPKKTVKKKPGYNYSLTKTSIQTLKSLLKR